MSTVIKVENLSKLYRLGEVGTGTISHDLNRWWAKVRGKEDPFAKIGQVNDRTQKAEKGEHIWALQDINFEVKQGEVLGIIGKNGAGKSTLLKILSKITSPSTGSIKTKGRVASLLEVGTGMHPEMTGRENVYLNGTIMGMSRKEIDAKFDEIIDFAGCAKYADTPVKRYSSGMKVRLGFAVAAFLEPEILIVDEVLAVGDAEFQKRAIGKMQDISSGEGRTVLFVSHNMASVSALCDRALLLDKGKIATEGNVEDVINIYTEDQSPKVSNELSERNDRKGNQWLAFKKIHFTTDYNKTYGDTWVCGKPGYIVLELQQNEINKEKVKNISFVLIIKDKNQNHVTTLHTRFKGQVFNNISNNTKIICKINKVSLMPSLYYVTVRILIGGQSGTSAELGDHIENAAEFHVHEYDYFGTGELPNAQKHGVFILDHEWIKQ